VRQIFVAVKLGVADAALVVGAMLAITKKLWFVGVQRTVRLVRWQPFDKFAAFLAGVFPHVSGNEIILELHTGTKGQERHGLRIPQQAPQFVPRPTTGHAGRSNSL
jgi:hypothetical protein